MSIKHTIQLIIKAQDEASKKVKEVENQVKKFSTSSKNSMNQVNQAFELNRKTINSLDVKLKKVGENGKSSFDKLSKSQQDSLVKFNMLDKETQNLIKNMNNIKLMPGMVGAVEQAKSKFHTLNDVTKTWSGSLDYAKSKLQLLGTDTDSLKGKLQLIGTSIQTYVGTKWESIAPKIDKIKNKVTALGSSIKTTLGNAIRSVSSRVESLGQAFDGIGGMIASNFGALGVNSFKEMTIEASISRDRIFNLSYAILGAGKSMDEFKNSSDSLWNIMDRGTNESLVGLDQISQAMSVINMSANASEEQLKELEPVILDIGQRAILMGKDGEEATALMQAAGKGLNGEFEMLRENLGITKDKLKDAGWDGTAEDIDGYTAALKEVLSQSGDVSDMMDTTYGKLTRLKKYWGLAGRSLGDEFLPYLDKALDSLVKFLDADNDGALDASGKAWLQYAYGVIGVGSAFAEYAPTITPMLTLFRETKGMITDVGGAFLKASGHILDFSGQGLELLGGKLQNIGPTLGSFKDKLGSLGTKFLGLKDKIGNIDFSSFTQKFSDLKNTIGGKFSWSSITDGLSSLKSKMLTTPFNFFKDNLGKMKDAIKGFKFSTITDSISNFGKMLTGVGGKVKTFGKTLIAEGSIKKALAAINIELSATESLALGPILLIIGAIIALGVAVFELGKHFGWWKDIPSMLNAVQAGLQRLWAAFINNPDVQDFIKGLGDAWNSVTSALGPVIDAVMEFLGINTKSGEEFDIVRMIIDGVGAAFHKVANAVRFAIGVFQTIYGVFQGIYSFLKPYGEAIYNFLKPIVCILLGCSPGIVPALERVQEVFQTVWSFIAGFIGSYVTTVNSIISTVISTVMSVINVFNQLLTGQISLSEAIPMIWNLISSAFTTILGTIITFVTTWAGNLYRLAVHAATNFVNSIINKIRGLPGSVYSYVRNTASRIRDGAATWATNAANAASNTVNSVVSNIQGLPGKVYQEFIGIGNRIKEAAAHVIQQASNFASGIKNKILGVLGIHSPGILQQKIGIEFTDISTKSIGEKASLAYENAKDYANNIVTGFESEDLSSLEVTPSINASTPDMALTGVTPQLEAPDTSAITDTVTTAYDTMNNLVGTDLQDLQYMNTQSFTNISLNEETMMKKIYSHVNSTLSTILKTNKTSLNQNTNTTKTQLSKMRNSTTTVTGQMVKAWNSMRTSIVSAARKIDSDATAHFNTLGKTIGGFYGKLQNPSRWGTGPGPKEERRGTGRGSRLVSNGHSMRVMSSRLANATIRENHMPRTITVRSVQNNPVLKGLTDFISDGSNIDVRTLFETGVLSPFNLGGLSRANFGAWENTAKPNIDKIKKTARNWSMKGPRLANRVSSGLTFHLKDFENGTPRIGMNDFINMAYALVNSTSYGYYANSERYGSWLNALNHGVMNCSDGSDMLIALARTCGLPASKVHCYWGTSSSGIAGVAGKGEGHFVARIGGRIMDSVSMRHGSLTSPKVHGYGTGPSPFKSLRESNNDNYIGSDDVQIGGKLEIIHKHEFEGLPQGIDEAKLARMINDAPNNERFVKQLANNVKFQIADHRAKVRFERKGNRSKGLGA